MKKFNLILLFLFMLTAAFAQEKSVPRNGEGVHDFLLRHNRSIQYDYDAFIKLNKRKLGKNNSLINGRSYELPPKSNRKKKQSEQKKSTKQEGEKKKTEPLFGKKYEDYTVVSNKLKGACFFLVSGHGGPDCGAIGKADGQELHEDEYAYDIMLRLARCLLSQGATVHIIIQDAKDGIRDEKYLKNNKTETCMGSAIPLNQKKRLQQRCDKINELSRKSNEKYQRAVFLHLDSHSKKTQLDVYFFYHEKSKNGRKVAATLRDTFGNQYKKHQPNRGFTGTVRSRNLFVLENTTPVAVFAELGNIQNNFDQKRFLLESNRQALAKWMCEGLIKDFESSNK